MFPFRKNCLKDYVDRQYSRGIKYYEARLIKLGFTGKERVLDAGCGPGQWSIASAKHNKEVAGIDISKYLILVAKRKAREHNLTNARFYVGNVEKLPFQDNYFDIVICYRVLPYVDAYKTLSEISRVLKTGGQFFLGLQGIRYYLCKLFYGIKEANCRDIIHGILVIWNTLTGFNRFLKQPYNETFQSTTQIQSLTKRTKIDIDEVRADPLGERPFLRSCPSLFRIFSVKGTKRSSD